MIVSMHISKIKAGVYEVYIEVGGVEITGRTVHASVSEAIFQVASDLPYNIASFVHIFYGALSCGTESVNRMKTQATLIANEIMQLVAAVRQDEEERATVKVV